MSWLSKFVFDPIKAAAARAVTSQNPAARSVGEAAAAAIGNVATAAANAIPSANSVVGQAHPVIAALEDGLRDVVDAALTAFIPAPLAVVDGPAVSLANAALEFAEQHALTYVSALFQHAKAGINTPAPAPGSLQTGAGGGAGGQPPLGG